MFSSTILRAAKGSEQPQFDFDRNPFKAKRAWPPDFDKLSDKQQFRLERRYKRRTQLKWARPKWMVATKLAQWGAIGATLTYLVLYYDWGDERVFKGTREWYRKTTESILGRPNPPPPARSPQPDSRHPS